MRTERQHGNGQEKFRPIEAIPAFKLAKNQPLEDLARYLRRKPKDFDQVMGRIIRHEARWRTEEIKFDDARGYLAEIYVRDRIFSLGGRVIRMNPIPEGYETSSHKFRYSVTSRLEAVRKSGGKLATAEYDALFLASELLVAAEVKSGGGRFCSAIHPETISNKLAPLFAYSNSDTFGYMAIGPQDILQRAQDLIRQFEEKGGVVVALPVTSAEFAKYAWELQRQNRRLRMTPRGHRQRARR